ncbi:MAG: RNA-binding cell elongation regulator Jag/EloR [Acidimicrobiales bacterium]
MEWVETTGRTLEEAREAALDKLGVDETDAEFEVLEEAKVGLFGRVRSEARVRARVRPTAPRAKVERRQRRRRGAGEAEGNGAGAAAPARTATGPARSSSSASAASAAPSSAASASAASAASAASSSSGSGRSSSATTSGRSPSSAGAPPRSGVGTGRSAPNSAKMAGSRPQGRRPDSDGGEQMEVALEEQARVAEDFLSGLTDTLGLEAQLSVEVGEEAVELAIDGDELGVLIGPRGATLQAIQDLTRTVVSRRTGATNGRIHVDVSGYNQKRSDALARFARKVAEDVVSSGQRIALEPMRPPDRKVVHDALGEVAGVHTISEGEEPTRRVVIVPDEATD